MFEPLSLTVGTYLLAGFAGFGNYARASSAVSPEATVLREAAGALAKTAETSESLFGGKMKALSQLHAMVTDCAEPGWDGGDAVGIDPRAHALARAIIETLPEDFPMPEFAPEPDGAISLDWIRSRHRMLSLTAGVSDRLAYAWLDGSDRGHAVARFDGARLPGLVESAIRSVVD